MNTQNRIPDDASAAGPPRLDGADGDGSAYADQHLVPLGTQEAGSTFDEGQGRVFPCENCGADLQFHIGMQSLKCPYCGHVKEIPLTDDQMLVEQDFHAMLQQLQQWREARADGQSTDDAVAGSETTRELHCHACGGNIEFVGTLTSSRCPYCDSPVQLDDAHTTAAQRIPVDGVLPFLIDHEKARLNLQEWVRSRWFAPNDFRRQGANGGFNGVYLSYFTYDSMTSTAWSGMRGEYYYVSVGSGKNQRTERRTRWYPASGAFQRFFDDVLVLANTGFRRDYMLELEPWPLQKVVPFRQQMLAGFMARTYDMDLDKCFGEAKERIDAAIHAEVRQRIGGDTQQVSSVKTRCDAITFKHLLMPVWLMAYRFRNTTYQIFINAATGEVQGERPWSAWKITLTVLLGLLVAGGIYLLTQQN